MADESLKSVVSLTEASPPVRDGELDEKLVDALNALETNIARAFLGHEEVVRLAITCLLAGGHLLVEDVPGVGKTTLARALARSIDLPLRRIQFTSDMLPSDIVGVSVFDDAAKRFVFHPGPIFNNIVLADEINRASPRTQSALLEAMHEGRISVDAETHELPAPFLVVATQNPYEFHGTYPLPESQLDRFLLRIRIGYPDTEIERDLLATRRRDEPVDSLEPVITATTLERLMEAVDTVHVEPAVVDMMMEIALATRRSPRLDLGISTRAALTTMRAARALAVTHGRGYVLPDDLVDVLVPALAHRVRLAGGGPQSGSRREEAERLVEEIAAEIPVPR